MPALRSPLLAPDSPNLVMWVASPPARKRYCCRALSRIVRIPSGTINKGGFLMKRTFVMFLLLAAVSHGAFAAEERKAEVVGKVSTPFLKALQGVSAQGTTSSMMSLKPTPNVVLEGAESAFIFPVAGSAGAFRTEAVLFNRLSRS